MANREEKIDNEDDIMDILFGLDNPNSSDIEFLTDIDSDEDDDDEVPPRSQTCTNDELVDSTVYSEPVITLPDEIPCTSSDALPTSDDNVSTDSASERPDSKSRPIIWYPKKDNEFSGNPPQFLDTVTWTMSTVSRAETPLYFFENMFPESLWELAVTETIRYAFQSGDENFTTNVKELKTYLAVNIIMTYIKYPEYRMYWSSKQSMRMDMIADSIPMRRFEKISAFHR